CAIHCCRKNNKPVRRSETPFELGGSEGIRTLPPPCHGVLYRRPMRLTMARREVIRHYRNRRQAARSSGPADDGSPFDSPDSCQQNGRWPRMTHGTDGFWGAAGHLAAEAGVIPRRDRWGWAFHAGRAAGMIELAGTGRLAVAGACKG